MSSTYRKTWSVTNRLRTWRLVRPGEGKNLPPWEGGSSLARRSLDRLTSYRVTDSMNDTIDEDQLCESALTLVHQKDTLSINSRS